MSNIDMNMIELTDAELEFISAGDYGGHDIGVVAGAAVGCVAGAIAGGALGMAGGIAGGMELGGRIGGGLEAKITGHP